MKLDPLKDLYTSLTPYCFGANNPINILDADGNILQDPRGNIIATSSGKVDDYNNQETYTNKDGSTVTINYKYVTIYTDLGRPVEAKYITKVTLIKKNQDGTTSEQDVSDQNQYRSNCHGYTFAGGKVWVTSEESIEIILQDEYKYNGKNVDRKSDVAVVTVDPIGTPSQPDQDADDTWHSAKKESDGDGWTDKNGPAPVRNNATLKDVKYFTPAVKGQEKMGSKVDVHFYNKNGKDKTTDRKDGTVENGVRFVEPNNK